MVRGCGGRGVVMMCVGDRPIAVVLPANLVKSVGNQNYKKTHANQAVEGPNGWVHGFISDHF